jgi:hypothetical protein
MPVRNPEPQKSILWNKEFGLQHLKASLAGVKGVSVIPFRIYRNPAEFRESHFNQDTPRFLLRLNLAFPSGLSMIADDQDKIYGKIWQAIPRLEPNEEPRRVQEIPNAMAELMRRRHDYLKLLSPISRDSIIVHPVLAREDYLGYGTVGFRSDEKGKLLLAIIAIGRSTNDKVWRQSLLALGNRSSSGALRLKDKLGELGCPNTTTNQLKRALMAIKEDTQKVTENNRHVKECETSFTIDKRGKLQFYDFLVGRLEDAP